MNFVISPAKVAAISKRKGRASEIMYAKAVFDEYLHVASEEIHTKSDHDFAECCALAAILRAGYMCGKGEMNK